MEQKGRDSFKQNSGCAHLLRTTVLTSCPLIPLLRPKDGPHRDPPSRSVHSMESGPAATEEPGLWGE